jgi:hypothetical protein
MDHRLLEQSRTVGSTPVAIAPAPTADWPLPTALLEPAVVFWFCKGSAVFGRTGELRSDFASLTDALSFVARDLPHDMRQTAWIVANRRAFGPREVQALVEAAAAGATAAAAFTAEDAALVADMALALRAGNEPPPVL